MGNRIHLPHKNAADFERRARRTVARRLRKCRRARKITQSTLAAHIGVAYQQIQKYETGRNRIPVERLMLIARILGEPVERLLGISRHKTSPRNGCPITVHLTSDGLPSLRDLYEVPTLSQG